jgi:hypothetical protein
MSLKDNDINGSTGQSPLHNFVKAKKKINKTFTEISKYLIETTEFISACEVADENKADVKKFAGEVSIMAIYIRINIVIN